MDPFDAVDLDPLAAFLRSERAPEGCMDLSELDGFLAGLVAGPAPVEPETWLPMIWDEEEPDFTDPDEAAVITGLIGARYQEIASDLDAPAPTYTPVFWLDGSGMTVTEDWAAGFMQAVALCSDAWKPALADDSAAALLIPIAAIAGLALPDGMGADLDLPDKVLDRWIERAEQVLPDCVVGLRRFWRQRGARPLPWPAMSDPRIRH